MRNDMRFILSSLFLVISLAMGGILPVIASGMQSQGDEKILPLLNSAGQTNGFGMTPLKEWKESPYTFQGDELPVKTGSIENLAVTGGMTQEQIAFLAKNGFVVIHSNEAQFADIRDQVAEKYGQPYYLTTDAAFHALHINFDALLKQLEKTVLKSEAASIVKATLDSLNSEASGVKGTGLQADMQLAQDYLAVMLTLLDKNVKLPASQKSRIQPQIDQIMAAAGRDKSALIPNFEDDYGAYKPVGHYAGDPDLEDYFRGLTWAGRVAFKFRDIENPGFKPSRAPLIISLTLRSDEKVWQKYTQLMKTIGFIIGPTDDGGPVETLKLMDSIYGKNTTLKNLADDQVWQKFLSRVEELPGPQINSTFANTTKALKAERSWRLMGQRFTLDALMFQNLIFDKVGSDTNKREFPSGLDVMAVMGSDAALDAQKAAGQDKYNNYLTQVDTLKNLVKAQKQSAWLDTFYSGWLYAFLPQMELKGGAYPSFMHTFAWQNKELNSALGSWAELKHDTALYSKMAEFMGGGGPPSAPPPPGYVETNPNVFYRLAYIAGSLKEGLELMGYVDPGQNNIPEPGTDMPYDRLLQGMGNLAEQLTGLGDIAAKELRGEQLTEEERYMIIRPLGAIEDHVDFGKRTGQNLEYPPVPVVAAVSGAQNEVLEVGVGKVDRIYVVVPINGKLQVAQGGVFTYYEFKQPRSNRLSDEEWRKKLESRAVLLLPYTDHYLKMDGKPVDVLAMRVGDIYKISQAGAKPPLNVRSKPSKSAPVLYKLGLETYFEILEGPQKADNLAWWKIKVFYSREDQIGWVAENQLWYDRAHGQ